MWLSEQRARRLSEEGPAELGPVTLEAESVGAYLPGERRGLTVTGPGGYCWRPRLGDQVLVIKTGEQGERPCVAGTVCPDTAGLGPGDVRICAGDAAVVLRTDGSIDLQGLVKLNGVPLEDKFARKPAGGLGGG